MTRPDYTPEDYADDIDRWHRAAAAVEADDRPAAGELMIGYLELYARMLCRALVGIAVTGVAIQHRDGHDGRQYHALGVVDGQEVDASTRVAAQAIAAAASGDRTRSIEIIRGYVGPDPAGTDRLAAVMAATLSAYVDVRKMTAGVR